MRKIAEYFGVSTDYLLGLTEKKQINKNLISGQEKSKMEREMKPVEVYISQKGFICIAQDDGDIGVGVPKIVVLHPSQVDLVIQWIKEVKEELQQISNEDGENMSEVKDSAG